MANASGSAGGWYAEPLRPDDLLAGLALLLFGCTFMSIYALVAFVMYKNDRVGQTETLLCFLCF